MSIEFITGKPGGGKSLLGVKMLLSEITTGARCVSTNLAMNIPRLREYLHDKYDGNTFNVEKRLRILTKEECGEFWLYRYPGIDIDPSIRSVIQMRTGGPKGERKKLDVVDYDVQNAISGGGTLFLIDEVHTYFNARAWASTGEDVLYYLSQHRKFGDDVICITQHPKQVETQFSRIAEFFYVCRNTAKLKIPLFGGIFKAPASLVVSQYDDISMRGAPLSTRVATVDRDGVASCYHTAAGVGFVGGKADTDHKPKGMPWWGLVIVFVVVGLALTKGVNYGISKTLGSKNVLPVTMRKDNAKSNAALRESSQAVVAGPRFDERRLEKTLEEVKNRRTPDPDVFLVGLSSYKKDGVQKVVVNLSDGQTYTNGDKELEWIGARSVIISGKTYSWKPLQKKEVQSEHSSFASRNIRQAADVPTL